MTALLLLLAAAVSAGSAKPIEVSGHLKNLWQYSSSAIDGRPYFLNTSRARLSIDVQGSIFRAQADYDQEVLSGSYFRTREFASFGLSEAETYLSMDHTIRRDATSLWRHRLYRGWVGIETEKNVARFGRQRVAWGTGKLWNPTDVLNAYQPLSVEREERRGVDAFYARQGIGDLSQAEAAYAVQDRWPQSALLGRLKSHWGEYDSALMGGKIQGSTGSWIVGGDFAGNLWEGTLHGEWSYTSPQTRAPFWKADLGYEYAFPAETKLWALRDAAVVAEYYHNGAGSSNPARYDFLAVLSGREVAVAQNYLGLTYAKDLHPLLKLELTLLTNLDDGSQCASPTLTWNALSNLYLAGGFQRFGGPKRTEFGRPANLGFLQAQYYF